MTGQVLAIQNVDVFFNAERLNMMMKMANEFVKSGAFGVDCKTAQAALVKMQTGAEMGMPPMEAMNSLYIINGHVTIFGMATAKRIRQAGWKIEYLNESDEAVTVRVTKDAEIHEYTATLKEVNKLNSRAVKFAQKDKLRWHALGRILRFYIPEVLGGAVSYLREELEDEIEVAEKVKEDKPKVVKKTFDPTPAVDLSLPISTEIIEEEYISVTPEQAAAKLAPESQVPTLEL